VRERRSRCQLEPVLGRFWPEYTMLEVLHMR
jgi:hypothetical protein